MAAKESVTFNTTREPPSDQEIEDIFKAFDRDNDGQISIDELIEFLRVCGQNPTRTEATQIMTEYDKNIADGALDLEECKQLLLDNWCNNPEQQLISAFRIIDQNQNGFIERKELKAILTETGDDPMTPNEAEEMLNAIEDLIQMADLDMNGKIDYYEFTRALLFDMSPKWIAIREKSGYFAGI